MLKLNNDLNSYISDELISDISFSNFNKVRFNKIYKYGVNKSHPLDQIYCDLNHVLVCDLCDEVISKREIFYSSEYSGDLCKSCYKMKIDLFKKG